MNYEHKEGGHAPSLELLPAGIATEHVARAADSVAKPKGKPGRKAGDPRNTGRPPALTVKCWWGCGADVCHATLREHWMKCPKRPKLKKKAAAPRR
jgi:hypothetical protein